MSEQIGLFSDNPEYEKFVEKFKPKKTTDDCYTPPAVYEVVKNWACKEYKVDPTKIIRPFYPGGDYEAEDYSGGKVVIDNPPFSILSEICEFYLKNGIPFFLFAPSLTVFSGKKVCSQINHIVCDADITYENGAVVRTAFVTNMSDDLIAQTAPELGKEITEAQKRDKPALPRYAYPDHVLTSAMLQKYSKYGIDLKIKKAECVQIASLDHQKASKKTIFGSGLLLSEKAAAEKAAAEKAAAEKAAAEKAAAEKAAAEKAAAIIWELSDREQEIVQSLGGKDG